MGHRGGSPVRHGTHALASSALSYCLRRQRLHRLRGRVSMTWQGKEVGACSSSFCRLQVFSIRGDQFCPFLSLWAVSRTGRSLGGRMLGSGVGRGAICTRLHSGTVASGECRCMGMADEMKRLTQRPSETAPARDPFRGHTLNCNPYCAPCACIGTTQRRRI